MALFLTALLSAAFFLGMLLASARTDRERIERISVPLAFGAMLGVAVFDIIPEIILSVREKNMHAVHVILITALGFFSLLLLDGFVPEHEGKEKTREGNLAHIGLMSALAVAAHNTVEGMSVFSIASESPKAGIILSLSVALHNLPMGMLIYSTVKGETGGKKAAVILISGLSTFFGGLLMTALGSAGMSGVFEVLTSLALGMVIYILFMELLPDVLRNGKKADSLLWIIAGLTLVIVGMLFE